MFQGAAFIFSDNIKIACELHLGVMYNSASNVQQDLTNLKTDAPFGRWTSLLPQAAICTFDIRSFSGLKDPLSLLNRSAGDLNLNHLCTLFFLRIFISKSLRAQIQTNFLCFVNPKPHS